MIFRAGDVGEDGVIVAFLDETHGDAGDRALELDAGVVEREAGAADRGHRRGAVRLENVGDDADGVGRLVGAGENGGDGALGECSVAHFATTDAGHTSCFTNAEGREVVVEHEVFLLLAFVALEALPVVGGAEGGGDQGLGFAAGEERGTVGAGQNAGLDADGADLVEGAAIGTDAFLRDLLAEGALAEKLVVGGELLLERRWCRRRGFRRRVRP